jgi:hypothetical protein
MNGVSGAPMPAKMAEVFRRMPHVAVASPVIPKALHGRLGRDSLRHRLPQLQRAEALHLPLRRAVSGAERRDCRRCLCARRRRPSCGRDRSPFWTTLPHLRHRGERQGRAQADAHRDHGRADRLRRQGLGHLHQERRSGQPERRHPAGDCTPRAAWKTTRADHGRLARG